MQDAASIVNDKTERANSNFLIRPLEKDFMKEHKIEEPPQSLQNCLACREGHIYKAAREASAHLQRAHFGGNDNLLLIAHMRRAHRYVNTPPPRNPETLSSLESGTGYNVKFIQISFEIASETTGCK
jgi:hypothetical protein